MNEKETTIADDLCNLPVYILSDGDLYFLNEYIEKLGYSPHPFFYLMVDRYCKSIKVGNDLKYFIPIVFVDHFSFRKDWSHLDRKQIKPEPKTYLMHDKATGFYKIGKSVRVEFREQTLSAQHPKVKVIATTECNIESFLHKKYAKYRLRGEWFDIPEELIAELKNEFKNAKK